MRRSIALILCLSMIFLSACSFYETDYFISREYESSEKEHDDEDGVVYVTSFLNLTSNISKLVSEHGETLTLNFIDYEGNITDDLAAACKQISTMTSLGLYCVDFISYDVDRIVAYYEAKVMVSYSRTKEEIDSIVYGLSIDGFSSYLSETLEVFGSNATASVVSTALNLTGAEELVQTVIAENSMFVVDMPKVSVNLYDSGSVQKIVEVKFSYSKSTDEMESMQVALTEKIAEFVDSITFTNDMYKLDQCIRLLINTLSFSEDAGATAYDALISGVANSQGLAMAYDALCEAMGINSIVVSGRYEAEQHYWNIVEVDGEYYHVDLSRALTVGLASTFMQDDDHMWGDYWWDIDEYPSCDSSLGYEVFTYE